VRSPSESVFYQMMTFKENSERFERHCKNIFDAIRRVEKLDKRLASELDEEYRGFLQALYEILDGMSKHLVH